MATQRELIEKQRLVLDKKFNQQYPNGRFIIQTSEYGDGFRWELHWMPVRVAKSRFGISIRYYPDGRMMQDTWKMSDTLPSTKNYVTLDELIDACKTYQYPQALVDAFVQRYIDRANDIYLQDIAQLWPR